MSLLERASQALSRAGSALSSPTGRDNAYLIAAGLKDAVRAYNGEDSNALALAQAHLTNLRKQAEVDKFDAGMLELFQGKPQAKPAAASGEPAGADLMAQGAAGLGLPQRRPQAQAEPSDAPYFANAPQAVALDDGSGLDGGPQTFAAPPFAAAMGGGLPQLRAGLADPAVVGGPTPNTGNPAPINDPRWAAAAYLAKKYGRDMSDVFKWFEMNQPKWQVGPDGRSYNANSAESPGQFRDVVNVNGWQIDRNNPKNEGAYLPKLQDGVIPDGKGGVVNVTGLTGASQAQAEAETLGKTYGTPLNVPVSDGSTMLQTGRQFFAGGGGPLVPQQGASAPSTSGASTPGGAQVGRTQRPDDKTYAESDAKTAQARYDSYINAGRQAGGLIQTMRRLQELDQGVGGGRLTPLGVEVASAAASLGVKLDPKLANKEAIAALTSKLVLDNMGGSLGTGFSNADRDFAKGMVPSLANTPQGRAQMIEFAMKKANREQVVQTKAEAWRARYGRIDARDSAGQTFEQQMRAWAERNPLMGARNGR